MRIEKINELKNYLCTLSSTIMIPQNLIHAYDATKVTESILMIAQEVEVTFPAISMKLIQAKDRLFRYNYNGIINPNPVVIGQVLAYLDLLLEYDGNKQENEWKCLHPLILQSSQKLYIDGNYAEAAVNAFIQINDRVKHLYMQVKPEDTNIPDGSDLMGKVFSEKAPLIQVNDIRTDTGRSIHNGTRFMLMGAISALRNPKAHSNDERITVTKEEGMRRLMFASLLMYKIDEAVEHSNIKE